MKRLLIIAVNIVFGTLVLNGQGDLNQEQKVFFRNEKSLGILLNTDGIGLSYRAAKRINFLNKSLIEIDGGILKHPKEYKLSNYYNQGGSFVFGKLNSTFYLKGGIGLQRELYKKADLGGIAIRYFYSAGPVLGIYKPIFYKVLYPISTTTYGWKYEKFTTSVASPQDIYSKASFFKGLDETRILPGLYAKGGLNFEYSKEDKIIHAVEIGCSD